MPDAVAKLLQPLRVFHQEWVDQRIEKLTYALTRFKETPTALALCFIGAVAVQAILVLFYVAVANSMHIPIGFAELAVIVPISFIVQMVPVSLNGFGVREATFGFYFTRLGLPLESALLVSFVGAALDHGVFAVGRRRLPAPFRAILSSEIRAASPATLFTP